MKCCYLSIKMVRFCNLAMPTAGKDTEHLDLSHIAGRNAKWYRLLGRQFDSFLSSQTLTLQPDNLIPSGIFPRQRKVYVHRKPSM